MDLLKQHIVFKGFTLFLVWTLLLPSAVKSMHIFENHQHEVCYGESDAHFHTLDIDCEFYNFKINVPYTLPEKGIVLSFYPDIKNAIISEYSFLSGYQTLHFSLRGPPVINLI